MCCTDCCTRAGPTSPVEGAVPSRRARPAARSSSLIARRPARHHSPTSTYPQLHLTPLVARSRERLFSGCVHDSTTTGTAVAENVCAAKVTALLPKLRLTTFPGFVCIKISNRAALERRYAMRNRRTPAHRNSTAFKTSLHGSAKSSHESFSMGHCVCSVVALVCSQDASTAKSAQSRSKSAGSFQLDSAASSARYSVMRAQQERSRSAVGVLRECWRKNIRVRAGSVDARFFGDHFASNSINALTRSVEVCYPDCS